MSTDSSLVRKVETVLDDLWDLWNRRKIVATLVIIILLLPTISSLLVISRQSRHIRQLESELVDAGAEKEKAASRIQELTSQVEEEIRYRDKAESPLQGLKSELSEEKRKRDKAELALAPFLAAADRGFPEAAEDQRLDLLLVKVEGLVDRFEDAARDLTPQRVVSQEAQERLIRGLSACRPLDVKVVSVWGDQEAFALACQIKAIFRKAGWKAYPKGVQAGYNQPVKHLLLRSKEMLRNEVQEALGPLFADLGYVNEQGYANVLLIDKSLPANSLQIIVGSK